MVTKDTVKNEMGKLYNLPKDKFKWIGDIAYHSMFDPLKKDDDVIYNIHKELSSNRKVTDKYKNNEK